MMGENGFGYDPIFMINETETFAMGESAVKDRMSHRGKALRLNMGDVATIRKSRFETKLVKLNNRSFYDVVNAKFQRKLG